MIPYVRRLLGLARKSLPKTGGGSAGHGHVLGADTVQDFLYAGGLLICNSDNVESATYSPPDKTLVIKYHGKGPAWAYDPINEEEALRFARADSKGIWLWDNVRIRGTRHGHKKNARPVR